MKLHSLVVTAVLAAWVATSACKNTLEVSRRVNRDISQEANATVENPSETVLADSYTFKDLVDIQVFPRPIAERDALTGSAEEKPPESNYAVFQTFVPSQLFVIGTYPDDYSDTNKRTKVAIVEPIQWSLPDSPEGVAIDAVKGKIIASKAFDEVKVAASVSGKTYNSTVKFTSSSADAVALDAPTALTLSAAAVPADGKLTVSWAKTTQAISTGYVVQYMESTGVHNLECGNVIRAAVVPGVISIEGKYSAEKIAATSHSQEITGLDPTKAYKIAVCSSRRISLGEGAQAPSVAIFSAASPIVNVTAQPPVP